MNNDNFLQEGTQFVLSYELLCLLRWLIDHHPHQLQQLITKALSAGLYSQIQNQIHNPMSEQTIAQDNELVQQSIIDFCAHLEVMLHEQITVLLKQKAREQDLLTTVEHIDGEACDQDTVRESIEKVTAHHKKKTDNNSKELLYKEILKRWKPHDKKIIN